ncbi:hypothetical protein F2Q69_00027263 [Brassica cretica]|uniref:Uncharacterized protein n=1 Tax=Brassica cretica TaxID=69181 RepID=A0A8S9S599_BRACR|nr:hypothetical protein F2Q69_00027263 [Brassica cretica]
MAGAAEQTARCRQVSFLRFGYLRFFSDTGGGNALNVQRSVKDFIAAGAAGCFLEDQAWPKRCGKILLLLLLLTLAT